MQTQTQPEVMPNLDGLHDIVVPEAVNWMPQTAGWYLVGVVILMILARGLFAIYRRHQANRYRRLALDRLATIESRVATADPATRGRALGDIPVLLKRTALSAGSRRDLASLTGDAWLQYLDDAYGGTGFREGPGRLLPTLAYASAEARRDLPNAEVSGLIELTRTWIRRHRARV